MKKTNETETVELTKAALEMSLIDEYLQELGYRMKDLCELPEDQAKRLMIEACKYASSKLAEIEAKAHFRHNIRAPGSS
jgi:hypothetical protein